MNPKPIDVDSYIADFPENVQALLRQFRKIITETVPEAEEVISYQMPSYKYHGMMLHFAAFKNHVGLYPGPSAITAFKDELQNYSTSKGTVQFKLDEPLPVALIAKIAAHRAKENRLRAEMKQTKKPK